MAGNMDDLAASADLDVKAPADIEEVRESGL